MKLTNHPGALAALTLFAALAPLSALATVLNVNDYGLVGQTLSGSTSRTLNLAPAIDGQAVGSATDGTLTLVFAEDAPPVTIQDAIDTTYYSPASYCCGAYMTANIYYTNGSPQSAAVVSSAGGASASGGAPLQTSTGYAYTGNTIISYNNPNGPQGSFYYVYSDYNRTINYSGDFTVTIDLNAADLTQIDDAQTFSYLINATGDPRVVSDSLHVDFADSALPALGDPLPAPTTLGVFAFAIGLLGFRRRVSIG